MLIGNGLKQEEPFLCRQAGQFLRLAHIGGQRLLANNMQTVLERLAAIRIMQ